MLDFLTAGGKVGPQTVAYRSAELPRAPFGEGRIAGVGYLQRLTDHGAKFDYLPTGSYRAELPEGLRFEATEGMFCEALCVLVERFVDEEYAWLDVENKVVIDVGANVGDSVIYFARRRAVHVYGYEPDAAIYSAAAHNLALNPVDNATVVRAAVSARSDAGGESAPAISLSDLLDEARSRHPGVDIVCKIDCEGCEFEILLDGSLPPSALDRVKQVMVEYHWREPAPLLETLRRFGFSVESYSGAPGVGWIRAWMPATSR